MLDNGAIDGDGHSLVPVKYFTDREIEIPEDLIQRHYSDPSDHKSTIFVGGKPVEYFDGVYSLDFHYWIADVIGVEHAAALFEGRGSQARAICSAISQWAKTDNEKKDDRRHKLESCKVAK